MWVLRKKCVLKSRLPYSDKECKKLRCGERSSRRERTHHAAEEMDDNCSIFSSTNSSIHHGLSLSGSTVKCTVQALPPNLKTVCRNSWMNWSPGSVNTEGSSCVWGLGWRAVSVELSICKWRWMIMSRYPHAQTHSSIHHGLILSGSAEKCRSIVAKFVNCW